MWPVPVRSHRAQARRARAALLFFHGLRTSSESLDVEGRAIAARGIDVFAPDAPHHGARRDAVLDEMPDTGTREGYATLLSILREARDEIPLLVEHAIDLGYERIAVGGVSLGGYIALSAAAVEPRLAAFVSILGSPDWTPRDGQAARDAGAYRDALAESPHLRPEAFAPRPLLMFNGACDENVRPEPARALAAHLRPIYEAAGAADALVHREWDVPHQVPEPTWREMIEEAATFAARALNDPAFF